MSDLFDSSRPMDSARTLALYSRYYQDNGPALPAGTAEDMRFVESLSASLSDSLSETLEGLEGLILDSYGVIGLGSAPIEGIVGLFEAAAARDIPVIILTNGASQPAARREQGYQNWGLPINASDIISSRDACYQAVKQLQADAPETRFSYLDRAVMPFDDVPGALYDEGASWDEADYFVFLGATAWGAREQDRLEAALARTGAKLMVGNPDVSAPVDGGFTFEPGFWAMKAQEATGAEVIMTGKPFAPAYQIAFEALEKKAGKALQKSQIGMVGDSLHTDILGAKSFGLHAILLSSYGLLAGRDVKQEAMKAQIFPDTIARLL